MKIVRIKYSQDQDYAFVDSCLYGFPYGYVLGEDKHIQAELAKIGYVGKFKHVSLDDKVGEHLVEIEQ